MAKPTSVVVAALEWLEARNVVFAEPVADVRKADTFRVALNRLGDAEATLTAAILSETPHCPFCGKLHAGSLPCHHCGEPDMSTPDEDLPF